MFHLLLYLPLQKKFFSYLEWQNNLVTYGCRYMHTCICAYVLVCLCAYMHIKHFIHKSWNQKSWNLKAWDPCHAPNPPAVLVCVQCRPLVLLPQKGFLCLSGFLRSKQKWKSCYQEAFQFSHLTEGISFRFHCKMQKLLPCPSFFTLKLFSGLRYLSLGQQFLQKSSGFIKAPDSGEHGLCHHRAAFQGGICA